MAPERIQLRRTKGWRKPEGAIVVSRPSKWGNPYKVGSLITPNHPGWAAACTTFAVWVRHDPNVTVAGMQDFTVESAAQAVEMYRLWVARHVWTYSVAEHARRELRGHDLACWCPLNQPCHTDVLLELANAPASDRTPTP